MSGKNVVIRARHISKSFRQYKTNFQKIRYLLLMRDAGTRIDVLRDVSFDIKKGERVGIIGGQQSGKTTLMRILAGVIRPDSGKVKTVGGVSPILDFRLGFDPAMTGRDNVMIMGTALGWTPKMIKEHEEKVFRYTGLTAVKDEPMKTYKKGSAARLGFAMSTEVRNDIILLDASLTLGGSAWNAAVIKRMKEFITEDMTFVMTVNRIPTAAKLCERGIVIHEGKVVFDGAFAEAAEYFRENCSYKSRKNKKPALEESSDDDVMDDRAIENEESDDDDDV
ncbi:MAG: ATP-binding cassette domain-containing protein [Mogibacterium sp.]|nr:ATP-binding cassette domain-containing protein [Mogibacterium sp.]